MKHKYCGAYLYSLDDMEVGVLPLNALVQIIMKYFFYDSIYTSPDGMKVGALPLSAPSPNK
jgi:hypothetical protein